jgi:hypothetical protein
MGKGNNSYCIDNKGFLNPIRLELAFDFGYFDDFIVSASILK